MRKTKTVLYSIWLASAVCCFTLLPSLAQSQGGTATLTVGDGSGAPGSQGNQITVALTNDVPVGGMQLDICDEDDFMVCAVRAAMLWIVLPVFCAILNELSDGCCRMTFSGCHRGRTCRRCWTYFYPRLYCSNQCTCRCSAGAWSAGDKESQMTISRTP